jgi:large subunit ribosomal protein L28
VLWLLKAPGFDKIRPNIAVAGITFPSLELRGCSVMASVCEVCGKRPNFGMRISHSHRRTKRRWNPNVQKVRAIVDGAPRRLHVCTSCIKAGKVVKP